MAAEHGAAGIAFWQRKGVRPLEPDDALTTLEVLLSTGEPEAAVINADWRLLAQGMQTRSNIVGSLLEREWMTHEAIGEARRSERRPTLPPIDSAPQVPTIEAHLLAVLPHERIAALQAFLQNEVRRVLGLPDAQIQRTTRFRDLGIDSLLAVELRNRLAGAVGKDVKLPVTLVFDYPTIEALTRFIAQKLQGIVELPTDTTEAKPVPSPPSPPEDAPESLAAEDAQQLLEKELELSGEWLAIGGDAEIDAK